LSDGEIYFTCCYFLFCDPDGFAGVEGWCAFFQGGWFEAF